MDPGGGDDEEMADWEESAGDLLAQFQVQSHGVNGPPVLPVVPLAPVKDSLELKLDAVEVPPLVNAHEFDFLPGHFDAHCIISEKSDRGQVVSYEVKLRSGEVKSVSPRMLH